MRYQLNAEELKFEAEVEAFIKAELDPEVQRRVARSLEVAPAMRNEWTRKLNRVGWVAPNWPEEHGGTGWSMRRRHQFEVLMRKHHAPETQGFGFNMVGPAIIKYGSDSQKSYYLPKIRNAEMQWCQGYSEPGAGSDLAGISTRAEIRGDHYCINGSKIWTSGAEHADHIFLLVRTDPDAKKQLGISFLLLRMDAPGIKVEPLLAFNGKRLWNQVFFDDVMVPREDRLGDENAGWTVAKNLLGNERLMVSRVAENKRVFGRVQGLLDELGLVAEDDFKKRLNAIEIRLKSLESMALRLLSKFDQGGHVGAEPSMLKLQGSQLIQAQDQLLLEIAQYYGLPADSVLRGQSNDPIGPPETEMIASALFHHRGYTIAGGASEIQKNIIAQHVLGL